MDKEVLLSDEFKELTEMRYTFVICFIGALRKRGIQLPGCFLKLQFKDLITPSGVLIATLQGHTSFLTCLAVVGNKVYSGSDDKTIRVWDAERLEHIATLQGHTDAVSCLTVIGGKVYSGSRDKTIQVWDAERHEHVATLRGHTDAVSCLTYRHSSRAYCCGVLPHCNRRQGVLWKSG